MHSTNLNKALLGEPYHFKTTEDIAHLLSDACIMSLCNCKKGCWHQELDEASSFVTTFNNELGRFRYAVMPFGATVVGDVFQCKLDQWFGHLMNVIVIAEDIMIVGKKPSNSDHDQALTALLETARKCNVQLNYEKLQCKKQEVDFFLLKHTLQVVASQIKTKSQPLPRWQSLPNKKQVQSFIGMINYLSKFSARLSEIAEPIWELAKDKVPFN